MEADLFHKTHRRHIKELNIVPILDMMTTVIFFLLLSTSFIEFTKITVPPSATSTITDPIAPPPVTPRIILMKKDQGYRIQLSWTGRSPGALFRTLENTSVKEKYDNNVKENPNNVMSIEEVESQEIMKLTSEIVKEFATTFGSEKTFQLGLSGKVAYQNMVGAMDGVQIGVGALIWAEDGKLRSAKENDEKNTVVPPANIVLVSYHEVDAETSKSGEGL
jgi:biopolymer transport protein ExbD